MSHDDGAAPPTPLPNASIPARSMRPASAGPRSVRRKTSARTGLLKRRGVRITLFAASTAAILLVIAYHALESAGITPRALGPYIERRASGHNPVITGTGKWLGDLLTRLDRGGDPTFILPALSIGAQPVATSSPLVSRRDNAILASNVKEVLDAIANARPGDVIVLLPGTYHFRGRSPTILRPGREGARITLKAQQPGTVEILFEVTEGFIVNASHWTFENLTIRGVCSVHAYCEHAFHIVGNAKNFIARNNVISDFNAHFKINGNGKTFPDNGLIEQNTLTNNAIRDTYNPVTVIDLVGASNWVIRRNVISDFVKGQSNRISYGGFAKGAGEANLFEQNIVLCEHKLRGAPGQRVGLSLGGGGTGPQYCRDKRCITEQDRGVIRANLIAFCSDDGIYVNRSAVSKIHHNTLLDTGGIVVRFPESSADVAGNLVDGTIRSRDGGLLRGDDNQVTSMASLYAGLHPVRNRYADMQKFDLAWKSVPPKRQWALPVSPDLCDTGQGNPHVYGAFRDFGQCLASTSPAR